MQRRAALIKTKSLERLHCFKDLPCQSLAPASSAQTAICVSSPPSQQNKTHGSRHAARMKHRRWFTAAAALIICLADEAEIHHLEGHWKQHLIKIHLIIYHSDSNFSMAETWLFQIGLPKMIMSCAAAGHQGALCIHNYIITIILTQFMLNT